MAQDNGNAGSIDGLKTMKRQTPTVACSKIIGLIFVGSKKIEPPPEERGSHHQPDYKKDPQDSRKKKLKHFAVPNMKDYLLPYILGEVEK
jgi:hypothetical protein